ncbi:glycosyltransferase [Kitasatospora sp. NPDC088391]|uniref:glycosyltransferase n=1 Tax=Kitasatospora sp. NPDC088391 TaxID=3364074 RepID=UPI003811B367
MKPEQRKPEPVKSEPVEAGRGGGAGVFGRAGAVLRRARAWRLLPLLAAVALLWRQPQWAHHALAGFLAAVFGLYLLRHLVLLTSALHPKAEFPRPKRELPTVTVLVPCHNEARVVDGLTRALAALDYPADRLDVVFVDDRSADATGDLLERAAADRPRWRVLRRAPDAVGGKSAALNEVLESVRGEITVVYDADHQPRPDSLRALVRVFDDPAVAAAQGRCVVRNPGDSLIARLVAVDYLCGYLVNMAGRRAAFGLPAYGGANCAVRTSVLRELGGWNTDSVTEDTDLTVRVWLSGRKVGYAEDAVDTELAVTTLRGYWRQRYRWARGHQQVCADYRGALLRSRHFGPLGKVEATLFLYLYHVPVLCAVALLLAALEASWPGLALTVPLWPVAPLMLAGPVLEIGGGLIRAGTRRREVLLLLLFPALFVVSMLLCTRALIDRLAGSGYSWVKTERTATRPNAAAAAAGSEL